MLKRGSERWNKFWSCVDKGPGCWKWNAAHTSAGYGQIRIEGKTVYTHRVVWEMGHGSIPNKQYICHTCDTPACVRPSHLFIGTQKDNMQDASRKGRTPRGELCGTSKLTVAEVKQIRISTGTVIEVSKQYNINPSTVSKIRLKQRWKHIK